MPDQLVWSGPSCDEELTLLQWPPQTQDLNPLDHLWDAVGWEIPIIDVQLTAMQQLCDVWGFNSHRLSKTRQQVGRNLWGMSPTACWKSEELRQPWRQKGFKPSVGELGLIKWSNQGQSRCWVVIPDICLRELPRVWWMLRGRRAGVRWQSTMARSVLERTLTCSLFFLQT